VSRNRPDFKISRPTSETNIEKIMFVYKLMTARPHTSLITQANMRPQKTYFAHIEPHTKHISSNFRIRMKYVFRSTFYCDSDAPYPNPLHHSSCPPHPLKVGILCGVCHIQSINGLKQIKWGKLAYIRKKMELLNKSFHSQCKKINHWPLNNIELAIILKTNRYKL